MPINQTVPWGKRGQIEYKPNWGQPIIDGQWRGAGAETTQTQPSAIDPRELVNANLESLWGAFRQQANTLKASGLDADTHNRILAGWQGEYNQAKSKLTGTMSQLDWIQQGIASGGITQEAGYKAGMKLVMPKATFDAMFPDVAQVTPSATGTAPGTSAALVNRFEEIGEDAVKYDPGWASFERVDKDKLKDFYKQERRITNLDDPRNINKVPGFNEAFARWTMSMRGGEEALTELLDRNTGDIDMIMAFASPSHLGGIVKDKIKGVSPMARTLNKQIQPFRGFGWAPRLPKQTQVEDFSTMSDEELRRIAEGR